MSDQRGVWASKRGYCMMMAVQGTRPATESHFQELAPGSGISRALPALTSGRHGRAGYLHCGLRVRSFRQDGPQRIEYGIMQICGRVHIFKNATSKEVPKSSATI